MTSKVNVKLMTFGLFYVCFLNATDWHDRKAEGWVWFEEDEDIAKEENSLEKECKELSSLASENSSSASAKDPEKELEAFKREFERTLKIAVWDPTPDHVLAFQKMQLIALGKSLEFGRVWQQNLLAYPQLDSSLHSIPSSQYGGYIQKLIQQEEKEVLFCHLAEKYGLIFFYEGDKLASKAASEVVKSFAKKYRWKLYGCAVSGHLIEEIEDQASAKKMAEFFNISIFPSLFMVEPENDELYPIGYGMVSQEKIEENIMMQFLKQEEKNE